MAKLKLSDIQVSSFITKDIKGGAGGSEGTTGSFARFNNEDTDGCGCANSLSHNNYLCTNDKCNFDSKLLCYTNTICDK